MKIAYLARVDIGKESGVLKKISRQIRCWQNEGNHVKVFLLSRPTKHIWSGISDLDLIFWQTKNYLYLFLSAIKAEQAIQDWTPDLIYWRYSSVPERNPVFIIPLSSNITFSNSLAIILF